ncbi:hypothetical protein NDU88_002531 [Pleurodeles waltl]|uniref:Uncharacterized protein n=1 Tax=Pleurodeles waltl TaxID=8319 RepID=A0AAV7VET7_PLEWA|nr:hypothetical protein NDU88_002531 [Pleurodeles waltl]
MLRAVTQQSCVTGGVMWTSCQGCDRNTPALLTQAPRTIVRIKGTKVTVRRGLDEVSRNISHVKKFHGPMPFPEEEDGSEHNCDPLDVVSPEGPSGRVGPGKENEPSRIHPAPAEVMSAPEEECNVASHDAAVVRHGRRHVELLSRM